MNLKTLTAALEYFRPGNLKTQFKERYPNQKVNFEDLEKAFDQNKKWWTKEKIEKTNGKVKIIYTGKSGKYFISK